MDCNLEKCPGTISIPDDVRVFGRTEAEQDNLMAMTQQHGLVLNLEKCEIKMSNMKFFGLGSDAEGVHPDPETIADIRQMKKPQTVTQLQEYIGIATYMSPFIPKLS